MHLISRLMSRRNLINMKRILFIIMLAVVSFPALAQTKQELENKKKQLNKEIQETAKILKETQKNKKATLQQLEALRKQIAIRESLINTINSEIRILDGQIVETDRDIESLKAELERLKKEYAAMIRFAYRNQSAYNKLMFVFASENFNQAYKRMKYLQQFSEYRQKQAHYIEEAQKKLYVKMSDLEASKRVKSGLLEEEQKEKVVLGVEKQQQEKMASALTDQEKKLKKQLADKQAQAKKLDNAIQAIIKREIQEARKRAEAAAKAQGTKPPSGDKTSSANLALTPEAQKLSQNFTSNKGKLPWPVEKGTIIEYFGTHEHPQLKGVMVQNNGIDIKTSPGAAARAIFSGTVSGVIQIPGGLSAVLIRHGEYVTVYSNLKSVSVKNGQEVSTKQVIGIVGEEEDVTSVELQIWKGMTKLNPVDWLAR